MENNILEVINTSALKLLETESLEQLYIIIVEEARKLIRAANGAIYLLDKDKLERTYASSPENIIIKINKKGLLEKHAKSNEITILQGGDIARLYPNLKNTDTKSLVTIPLFHTKEPIGFLMLHSINEEKITREELYTLKLYGTLASLAITKTRMYEEAIRALELRDRFISLASHELRTPLTSINGYIQLLYGKLAKKNTVESRWVEELYNESIRMTSLVKDILDINRIKQGQLAFVLSEVNIKEIIENAIDLCRYRNPDYEIIFKDKISDNKYYVIGDAQKLLEMVSALIDNAIKFSGKNSKITISLTKTLYLLRLVIKDQGKGIPKCDISKIFDGFYKTEHAKEKEGMGVGLMLAKHVVSHHRGKMNITSKVNKGTTVEVTLPSARI